MKQSTSGLNTAYTGLRSDIISLITGSPGLVLDVGCASGDMGQYLKDRHNARVYGIDYDPQMIAKAKDHLYKAWQGNLNAQTLDSFEHEVKYDLIIMGDILEHLINPVQVLQQARAMLKKGGHIITSLPNVNHYTTIFSLLFLQKWPYRKRGIHDETHLRFYTKRNMKNLFNQAEVVILKEKRIMRIWESQCRSIDWAARLLDFFPFRGYLTFQYLHLLRAK